MNHRKAATLWGAILGIACSLMLVAQGYALSQEFHQTYPISADGRLELDNINGAVHVSVWDRNEVKVDAVKTAGTQERLDEAQIKIEAGQSFIDIRTEYPHPDMTWNSDDDQHNPASVEYTLTVPRNLRIDEIKLINGNLDLAGLTGEVRASSINGRVNASNLTGPIKLSTINGRLEASFSQLNRSRIELNSVNGKLVATLPSDCNANLEASTVSGSISNDFGLETIKHRYVGHSMRGELGNGETRVHLSNVNGGIEVRHANDNRPLSPAKSLNRNDRDEGDNDDEI
jgi:hypothetical protein